MRQHANHALHSLRLPNGLYLASPSQTYGYVWIRDNVYIALAYLEDISALYEKTFHAMLDIFRQYIWKLEIHAKTRPKQPFEYIHPRYTSSGREIHVPWGNAQNDAVGAFLYGIGEGLRRGRPMLRDNVDRRVIELLVQYLITLEYWRDADNGIWEENREVHASSIGACVAGLLAIEPYTNVDFGAIRKGMQQILELFPNESATKTVDLALLSLIYPYQLLPRDMGRTIVENVEAHLLRKSGVIRYGGDKYYAQDGEEAEWCFGLPWLGLCHSVLGRPERARGYLEWTEQLMREPGILPELILGKTRTPNENNPLGWSCSMYMQLTDKMKGMSAESGRSLAITTIR